MTCLFNAGLHEKVNGKKYSLSTAAVLQVVINYSCLHKTKIKVPYSGIHTWIDLKTVITLVGIFKQAVHWIEHFVRKEKEPLSDRKKNYDTYCWVYNQNWLSTAIFHSYHTLVQTKQSLPCNTTVVQAFLSFKDNIKPTTQVMWSISHDLVTKTEAQQSVFNSSSPWATKVVVSSMCVCFFSSPHSIQFLNKIIVTFSPARQQKAITLTFHFSETS